MAELPAGSNANALKRAREIRFQLAGQAWAREHIVEWADKAFGEVEVLLSSRRWQEYVGGVDFLRKAIKSACQRLAAGISAGAV